MAKYKVKFKEGYQDLGAYALLLNIIEKGGLEVEILGGAYSREILTLPIPGNGDTVNVTTSASDTIIRFNGILTDDFTLNVTAGPDTTPGDRIDIFLNDGGAGITVDFLGNLNNVTCGDSDNNYSIDNTQMVCLEMIYDGENFTGIDNC
jgi:hypothetical protein